MSTNYIALRLKKTVFMLNLTEHEIYHAPVKMPTIDGILTFILTF